MVQTPRGGIKCNNKDCDYQIKGEEKPKKKTLPQLVDGLEVPPLMEEPQYFDYDDETVGYFPEGLEDVE